MKLLQRHVHRTTFFLAVGLALIMTRAISPAEAQVANTPTAPQTIYDAITDTKTYAKPPLPKLGPAGFSFTDPTFGCRIARVSDSDTLSGESIVTPSRTEQNPWNADSTIFCVLSMDQSNIPYLFDAATMQATRIKDVPTLPNIHGAAAFSYHDPDICYGKDERRGVIVAYNFKTKTSTDIIDIAKVTGLTVNRMDELTVSANDVLSVTFGGAMQDAHPYLLTYDTHSGRHHLWNTRDGMLDDKPLANAAHFTQHSSAIDRTGRFVWTLGPGVTGGIILDLQQGTEYPLTVEQSGHSVLGYGDFVNDVHKWIYRTLDQQGIDNPVDLMEHPDGEPYFAYDSHISWNNTRPDAHVPVLISTDHGDEMGDPRCAYGDEIIAVATDGTHRVWRFAHHRSKVHVPSRGAMGQNSFWDSPRGNVSQDGRFFMFTSNWEDTLGTDPMGRYRDDVFIVKLKREGADTAAAR